MPIKVQNDLPARAILESENIDPEDLEREPVCRLCGGSGWRGAVMCECLQELCRQEQKKVLLQSLALELEKVLAQWSLMALTLQLSFLPGSELQLFPQPSFLPGYPWYLWMYSYFLFHPDDNKAPDPLWKCSGKSPLPLQVADSRSRGNHWSYRSARQRMNAIWHHAYQYFH